MTLDLQQTLLPTQRTRHRCRPLRTHSKAECSRGLMSPVLFFLPKALARYITPSALGINNSDGKSKAGFSAGGPSTQKPVVREMAAFLYCSLLSYLPLQSTRQVLSPPHS